MFRTRKLVLALNTTQEMYLSEHNMVQIIIVVGKWRKTIKKKVILTSSVPRSQKMAGRSAASWAAAWVVIGWLWQASLAYPLAPTDGVHPSQLEQYSGPSFSCTDGSKIDASQINDDFCDCADGSDEPATAACSTAGGQFWCVNKGHHGKFLFSSFVNDGVCDCCDGSDEDGSLVQCSNRCEDVGREIRRQLQRQIEMHEAGHSRRAEYAQRGANFRQGVIKRKEELESQIAPLTAKRDEMQKRKDELQEVVNVQRAAKEAEEVAAKAQSQQEQAASGEAAADVDAPGVHAADDGTAAAEAVPPQSLVEEGQAVDDGAQTGDNAVGTSLPEVGTLPNASTDQVAEAMVAESRSAEQDELDRLAEEMKSLEEDQSKKKNELDLASRVLEWDFGPDDAFMALYDKCFSKQVQQYEYEVCLFRSAKQTEGGSSQNLGTWGRWNTEGDAYSIMTYDNGGSCWNGPARSMKVTLVCGEDEFVVSVQEPRTCEYEMELMTPLACTPEKAQQARDELAKMGFPPGSSQ